MDTTLKVFQTLLLELKCLYYTWQNICINIFGMTQTKTKHLQETMQ